MGWAGLRPAERKIGERAEVGNDSWALSACGPALYSLLYVGQAALQMNDVTAHRAESRSHTLMIIR